MIKVSYRKTLFFHLFVLFFLLHVVSTSLVLRERVYIWGGGVAKHCAKAYIFIYVRPSSVHPRDIYDYLLSIS